MIRGSEVRAAMQVCACYQLSAVDCRVVWLSPQSGYHSSTQIDTVPGRYWLTEMFVWAAAAALTPGAPVVDGRGVVAAGDSAERGAWRDPGRHAVVGALRRADHRHGALRAPPPLPHGRWLQGRGRRHRHRELLGGGRRRQRRAAAAGGQQEALPHRGRRRGLRRVPRRGQGDPEGHHHQAGRQGAVPAAVAQALRRRVPEVQPPRRRRQALQHQLHGIRAGNTIHCCWIDGDQWLHFLFRIANKL
jgi:hypothetical protein